MIKDGTARIYYTPSKDRSLQWYSASLRHDLRELGLLGGEETDEERAIRLAGPPSQVDAEG